MKKKKSIVGLITYHKLSALNEDDQLLAAELIHNGFEIRIIDWEDAGYFWSALDLIILRSVWNYHLKYDKFIKCLNNIESKGIKIWNNCEILKWNSNKKYLKEISIRFPTIDSFFLSKNQLDNDLIELREKDWGQIIIKPVISASAFNTIKSTKLQIINNPNLILDVLDHSDIVIQPFIKEIETVGEWSVIFFNGEFSHSVLKIPKSGDYRTQPELGGIAIAKLCPEEIIKTGRDVIKYLSNKFDSPILYARIDGIELNGKFTLMEIELIEPFLYFGTDENATHRFVKSLIDITN